MANDAQVELWGNNTNSYPPRTIIEVDRLNEDDIIEVEGTFWKADAAKSSCHT